MKKALFILLAMALAVPSLSMADGPQYEVTINVVFNSIDHTKASEIIKDAQERYGSACKVEIQSKKVSSVYSQYDGLMVFGTSGTVDIIDAQISASYAFGDIGTARIACGDSGVKKSADGEYYECKE